MMVNVSNNNFTSTPMTSTNQEFLDIQAEEGSYYADINSVETTITVDKKGAGEVRMIINCTPSEDHFGIYLRTIGDANSPNTEVIKIITEQTYAMNGEDKLGVYTEVATGYDLSYYIRLQNSTLVNTSKTLIYYFAYEADFFLSNQIYHYEVNPELVVFDLIRPDWDGDLEYQKAKIILPIDVGESSIPAGFLDDILFQPAQFMIDNYNLTYSTQPSGDGEYWLVFEAQKNNMIARAPFELNFYFAINLLSLPKVFNWLVITLVLLIVILALALFIVVISVKNQSEKEVNKFKDDLYKVLEQEEK